MGSKATALPPNGGGATRQRHRHQRVMVPPSDAQRRQGASGPGREKQLGGETSRHGDRSVGAKGSVARYHRSYRAHWHISRKNARRTEMGVLLEYYYLRPEDFSWHLSDRIHHLLGRQRARPSTRSIAKLWFPAYSSGTYGAISETLSHSQSLFLHGVPMRSNQTCLEARHVFDPVE